MRQAAIISAAFVGLTAISGNTLGALIVSGSGSGFGSAGTKSASVAFDLSGTDLLVTLTNSAASDVLVPADVLTAVLFDVSGGPVSLTRTSALLANGSTVFYDPSGQPQSNTVGGEWAYRSALAGAPGGRAYGISATGLGLFGPGDRFPGPDLSSPASPAGIDYGLLSAGDDTATGNGGITGSGGLIKNSATFTLSGLPAGFDLGRINNVYFLYGSAIGEGGFTPAPGSLMTLGAAGLACSRRRR